MTTLILGGTGEARTLAQRLVDGDQPVVSSLAGAVANPRLPVGGVRIGGFGGPEGLSTYLRDNAIRCVVDATHPFAATISGNAAAACAGAEVPLLRLERPGWSAHADADTWTWVEHHRAAAESASALGRRVLLTTGRRHLDLMIDPLRQHDVLVRVVDAPPRDLPVSWSVLRSRGPYDLESERNLFQSNDIDVLVTKDSGGALTEAKLSAARELGIPVVVVRRPTWPGQESTPTVTTPVSAYDWLAKLPGYVSP